MPNKPILLIFTISLLFLSCSKPDEKDPQIETMQPHQTWTDSSSSFFDNLPGDGIQTDTTWGGDTTIYL